MEMVLTGRNFSADDAERRGLISRVVREGSVVDEAVKVASTIAKKGQIAVQAAKEGVNACKCFVLPALCFWCFVEREYAVANPLFSFCIVDRLSWIAK